MNELTATTRLRHTDSRTAWTELVLRVDGQLLTEIFQQGDGGLPVNLVAAVSRHLGGAPAAGYAIDGRTALLVCSECADLGCGAVLARIDVTDRAVVWSDFVFANDYEPADTEPIPVDPLTFDKAQYQGALAPFWPRTC